MLNFEDEDKVTKDLRSSLSPVMSRLGVSFDVNTMPGGVLSSLKEASNLPIQNAGIYSTKVEGLLPYGADKNGNKQYVVPELYQKSGFTELGQEQLVGMGTALDSLGAFSDENEARSFDNLVKSVSNPEVLGKISTMLGSGVNGDTVKGVMSTLGFTQPDDPEVFNNPANLPTALGTMQVLDNWEKMTDTQRSLSLAGLAMTGYKFQDGKSVGERVIAKTKEGKELTTGAALSFLSSGINVPELLQNWDEVDAIQRMTFGAGSPSQMVGTAKRMGLLSSLEGTPITEAGLGAAGFKAAPSGGIGAIVGPADKVPQGYSVVRTNPDGTAMAVPQGMEDTATSSLTAMRGVNVASTSAMRLTNSWAPGAPMDSVKGGTGNVQMLSALKRATTDDPYLLGAVVANSTMGNMFAKGDEPQPQTVKRSSLANIGINATRNNAPVDIRQAAENDSSVRTLLDTTQAVTNLFTSTASLGGATNTAAAGAQASGLVGAVSAGERLYKVLNNPKATDKEKMEAMMGASEAGSVVAAQAGVQAAGEALPYIGAAMAAYNASKVMNSNMSDEEKARALTNAAEDTAAAYSTFGLSAVAQYVDRAFLGGKTDKARNKLKDNEMLYATLLPGVFGNEKFLGKAMSLGGGKSKDQMARDQVRAGVRKLGLVDDKFQVQLADGSFADVGTDGKGGKHEFRNPNMLPKGAENRSLNAYDVDYTNDLDYAASMGTMALTRLITGAKGTNIDQFGGQLANAALGNVGYGKDMTPENFEKVMANVRGFYAKSGITSKEDAYALANEAFSQGRLSEFDYIQAKQSADMLFDENGFETASILMEGRWKGLEVASDVGKAPGPNLVFKQPAPITGSVEDVIGSLQTRANELLAEWDAGNYWGVKNSGAIPKLYQATDQQVKRATTKSSKDITREEIARMNQARYNG